MRIRVWRYETSETGTAAFESAYGSDGEWARLFAHSSGYLGTELYRSVEAPGRYVTIDRFTDFAAWQAFREQHADEYAALDGVTAHLTVSEQEVVAADVP